ncbi:MAG: phosphoglucosamine mutase [Patescibacteria group bacterium]
MSLIKSISGIRGVIGGAPGENLTPPDIVKFTAAFGMFIKQNNSGQRVKIIIGRDARISGEMVKNLVIGTLLSQGIDIIDLGLASTPTVELAVASQDAQGGVILSASHNPQGWNALKLLNSQGEFLSPDEGETLIQLAEKNNFDFVSEEKLGTYLFNPYLAAEHLRKILQLALVDKNIIAQRNFKIVVDGINSVGGMIVPELLKVLGVNNIVELNCEPNGQFTHQPEPLAKNLTQIMDKVKQEKADLGIVVDPDVDRLAFINEKGEMLGEEYTLVAVADYVLRNFETINISTESRSASRVDNQADNQLNNKYNKSTVSNLSSSRALKDITEKYQGEYQAAAVGEVNVVRKMKEIKAIIGGEGNGGIIYPELHYGRDALVGIALFLTHLAKENKKVSELRQALPEYFMVKDKLELQPGLNLLDLLLRIKHDYESRGSEDNSQLKITDIDGLKIDWTNSWVHLRSSNTEPIIRIYAEAKSLNVAEQKVKEIKEKILAYIK